MKRRFRVLAALLALFAFSASFAEGLWASTCGPMDAMASMDRSTAATPAVDSMSMAGHADMAKGSPVEGASEPGPACPLTAVTGGCVVVFSPAPEAAVSIAAPVHTRPAVAPDVAPDLLLVSSLLRPPRA